MVKIRIGEVYTASPEVMPTVTMALNDILSQRISSSLGMKVRRLLRVIQPEIDLASEERDRLIDKYVKKDKDGKPVTRGNVYDFGENESAFATEWRDLLNVTFECEPIQASELDGLQLNGTTYLARIISDNNEDAKPQPAASNEPIADN